MNRTRIQIGVMATALLLLATPRAHAQAVGDESKARPVQGNPGIAYSYIITDGATQVGRGYAQPGATRRMHKHDNVTSHVFVLLTGEVKLTIEGEAPLDVHAGDALPLKPGVNHSFTNTGQVVATFVEVFQRTTQ